MRNFISVLVFGLLVINTFAQNQSNYVSEVWVADNGDGTYRNPILYADYSDPDVTRIGDDYYMTASSFNAAPGLPILHSKDMVNWELINHALPRQFPEDTYKIPQHGNGVWAPSIRSHNDQLYIYWGDPDQGIFMVKTDDPYGKWEKPVLVMEGKGLIDSCPLWDDDGKAYLVHAYAGSRAGVKSLLSVNKMNKEGTKVLDAGRHVFDGHDNNPTIEGPKFYKRNGYYYIFAPAGGVPTGWQLALRSKNIYGPYEEKKVLEQGSTEVNGPHQGAWVQTPSGEDWFFHFQDMEAYGRVVHLEPMKWENDWPVIGIDQDGNGIGEPVNKYKKPDVGQKYAVVTPRESTEFEGDSLGLQWQWNANPDVVWHAKLLGSDHLRLFSIKTPEDAGNLWLVPNLLLQKFPAPDFKVTTKISLYPEEAQKGKKAGLIIMGMDYATLTISHDENGFFIEQTTAINANEGKQEEVIETKRIGSRDIVFRIEVKSPNASCSFSYSEDGENFKKIGKAFKAKPGKWIGAKVGLFSVSTPGAKRGGYADVNYFKITK